MVNALRKSEAGQYLEMVMGVEMVMIEVFAVSQNSELVKQCKIGYRPRRNDPDRTSPQLGIGNRSP
jgi:hypothetical protein